ncbi:hypothetical protein SAMN04487977_1049 [Treponema bryantii]|uniref:Outer membrane protease n=1 Tax=Treponema bryantii TaxID=163 RepID=A0A1H9FEG3_9SPIR|nr:hypothetical protein [Treponema bryantii]SEQ36330.1 hypothetical protein SAMN04487977_1049 [Treponema bryantii]
MKKKSFIVILFYLILVFSCFSETSFSFGGSFGASFEKNGEYVYSYSGKGVVSYLDWQCLPLYKIGLISDVSFDNFKIKTGFTYGLPIKCGKMYDSDWGTHGVKNTYSISNNYAIQNFDFNFSLSYRINIWKLFLIPELSFDYYYDSFQSGDGEGWYGSETYSKTGEEVSWDSPNARHYSKISRIDLKRNSFFIFFGIGAIIPLNNKFEIGLGTFISPYSYFYNSDYHYDDNGTNRDFYLNSVQKAYFTRFKEIICLEYKPTQLLCIDLETSFIFGGIEKGLLEGYEQYAGTDVLKINIKLSTKMKF